MENPAEKGKTRILKAGNWNNSCRLFPPFRPGVPVSSPSRGFTLMELIVVITLISVMTAFAFPRVNTALFRSDSRELSQWILLTARSLKKKSVSTGTPHILRVDLDNHRFRTRPLLQAGAEAGNFGAESKDSGLELPDGFRLLDVQFVGGKTRESGTVAVRFYKKGYCDRALIHVEDAGGERITYEFQPFLYQVRIHESYFTY
ncbi:MAG: prepilin-type N-terminal cleavage/methylation domain-containing protein [Desulfosalsimonadaceae bacterium]